MHLHLILYSKIFKDYIMKRIIMFKGGVETLEFFSVEIAEYLESKGYEISGTTCFYQRTALMSLCTIIIITAMNSSMQLPLTLRDLRAKKGYITMMAGTSGTILVLQLLISLLTTLYITISFLKLCLNIIVRSILTICILII